MFQNLHYDTAGRMHVGSPTKIPLSLQEAKPTISSHGGRIYQIQKHILVCPPALSCRYNVYGFMEELPQLPESRWDHACAALPATGVRLRPTKPN